MVSTLPKLEQVIPFSGRQRQARISCGPTADASTPAKLAITHLARRDLLLAASVPLVANLLPPAASADDFITTPSGLRYLDLKKGDGATPGPGDTCVVHWAGYTEGYQGKRIDNTSVRDEPFEFVLGKGQVMKKAQLRQHIKPPGCATWISPSHVYLQQFDPRGCMCAGNPCI